jgi:hypothetical protein
MKEALLLLLMQATVYDKRNFELEITEPELIRAACSGLDNERVT